jgi:RimJ/RimL family protein N-acetyltransferase
MKDCFIDGDLVYLRLPDIQEDVIDGGWHEWFNNDEITKYLYHGVYPNSREQQVDIVKDNLKKSDMILLSIIDKSTDELCGIISLKDIDLLNRIAEMTIVMDKGNYTKNAPLEAWALMTSYGFEKLNLNKINAGHHIELWKWVNKVELLGYKLEGCISSTHIKYGTTYDSVRIGVLAKDYFKLLTERNGLYLSNNLESLLKNKRVENICAKFSSIISNAYE